MTDHLKDENHKEVKEESFAAMLDAYSPGLEADIGIGDKIRGKIISIGKDAVFVDTGTKIDGVVDKAELMEENQRLELEEGDVLELYVVALTDDEIRLSKAISGIGGFQMLMMGILGEYLWRALDESRRRPKYWIEETTE